MSYWSSMFASLATLAYRCSSALMDDRLKFPGFVFDQAGTRCIEALPGSADAPQTRVMFAAPIRVRRRILGTSLAELLQ
jgi:hypothetical protein